MYFPGNQKKQADLANEGLRLPPLPTCKRVIAQHLDVGRIPSLNLRDARACNVKRIAGPATADGSPKCHGSG